MIKDVTDLDVYRESLRLMGIVYLFLRKVPASEYDTVRQCKKCAKSIPAQIAEGFAKRLYPAEFKRFLMIAIGNEYKILSKRLNRLHKNWGLKYPNRNTDSPVH